MITKNQGLLSSLGVNNGAIGKIVDIFYDRGVRPPQPPAFIVVDIPGYKGISGNEAIPGYPTYIPLTVDTGFCEKKMLSENRLSFDPCIWNYHHEGTRNDNRRERTH